MKSIDAPGKADQVPGKSNDASKLPGTNIKVTAVKADSGKKIDVKFT